MPYNLKLRAESFSPAAAVLTLVARLSVTAAVALLNCILSLPAPPSSPPAPHPKHLEMFLDGRMANSGVRSTLTIQRLIVLIKSNSSQKKLRYNLTRIKARSLNLILPLYSKVGWLLKISRSSLWTVILERPSCFYDSNCPLILMMKVNNTICGE